MALWLTRAGRAGEYEKKFLNESRIYLTWEELNTDLDEVENKEGLTELLVETYPDESKNTIRNWVGQIWIFAKSMEKGDWIVLPSKMKPAIHIGEITGEYIYNSKAEDPYFHYRKVKWLKKDIPRSNFDQDILYSLGAFLTVCRISRNDAEKRIKEMSKNGWKSRTVISKAEVKEDVDVSETEIFGDLELSARDQIAKFILRKFKGHGVTRLVEAVLQAQGYVTFRSPEGPDKGVDILAAQGTLGFGRPSICVQVKSTDNPIDRPTLDQLIGTMQNFNAEHGLLVSLGGFKSSIDKEVPAQFFRVRLWDQDSLIDEIMANYDKLDEDIRAELPLKRIWTLTIPE